MPDPLRKVQRGQKLKGALPAAAWNQFIDNLKDSGLTGAGTPKDSVEPANTALMKWLGTAGSTLPAFSVLAYGGAIDSPEDNAFKAAGRPFFYGADPSSIAAPFAVTLVDILGQQVGRVAVSGLVPVQVDITDILHRRAKIIAAETDNLTSATTSGVPIVWPQSFAGTGVQWCFILLTWPRLMTTIEFDVVTDCDFDPDTCEFTKTVSTITITGTDLTVAVS